MRTAIRLRNYLSAALLCVAGTSVFAWSDTYPGQSVGPDSGQAFVPNGSGSNLIWFSPSYNTPAYQALYGDYTHPPGSYVDSTNPTLITKTLHYGKRTFALKTAGNYSFSVMTPGTTLYETGTAYDLQATLYAQVGASDPFNPADLYQNLIAYNDDTMDGGAANPYPLWYIKQDSSTCVTVTLVYTSWHNDPAATADITVNGPAPVAASCAELMTPQSITFASTPPSPAYVGSSYDVVGTGGASGNPVTFTIDPASSAMCTLSGNTVSFTAPGSCMVLANQAGNTWFEPAPQVNQSFAITAAPVTPPAAVPTPVPSLSQWSLMLLASLLGGLAFWRQRRKS